MKTYSATPKDIKKEWLMFDAEGVVLGRMASHIAKVLRGKHKPSFTPNMDCGDNVVIINADKVKLTGRKKILSGEHPERVVKMAIERMLPKDSPLARQQMKNLHVYNGSEHPHAGQTPKLVDFAAMNVKNAR
jgi:large subunit ribosomal protein L13